MINLEFPYGKEKLMYSFHENELNGVLVSSVEEYKPEFSEAELVINAMKNPVGSKKLSELSVGKNKVVIIASDHTRPVPSKVIIPYMLKEIREDNAEAET